MATLGADNGNTATGIMLIYQSTQLTSNISSGLPYFSISLSLNVLLTLMIATRLILYARNTRIALGIIGIGGLCKAAVTMLIESCALNAASSLLVLGWWSTIVEGTFPPILAETRVRALPRPHPPDRSANAMTDWAGHSSAAHH